MKYFLIAICLCFNILPTKCQETYFTLTNILKFADHLKNDGDYIRAASEYQRYLFLSKDSCNNKDSINFLIGRCYQKANNFGLARKYFNYTYQSLYFTENVKYQQAVILIQQGNYLESIHYLDSSLQTIKIDSVKNKMNLLKSINYIYLHKWQDANKLINNIEINSNNRACMQPISDIVQKSKSLKYKSPLLAGIFSTIIPGSGKLYVGRGQDAIYSFLLAGLCSWQSYEGFSKYGIRSFKGWAYFTIGAVFYTGNIYGSIVSAKVYNQSLDEGLVQQLNISICF